MFLFYLLRSKSDKYERMLEFTSSITHQFKPQYYCQLLSLWLCTTIARHRSSSATQGNAFPNNASAHHTRMSVSACISICTNWKSFSCECRNTSSHSAVGVYMYSHACTVAMLCLLLLLLLLFLCFVIQCWCELLRLKQHE